MSSGALRPPRAARAPKALARRTMPRQARKPCSGCGLCSQDQIAQRRGRGPDRGGVRADALDGPAGIAPMARRHVLGHRGVPVRCRSMRRCAATRSPLANSSTVRAVMRASTSLAGEAVGHAVVVAVDLDVIVDADPAHAPLGEHIGLGRQGLERRAVELLEQLAARHAEPPDRPLVVELASGARRSPR